MNIIDRLDLIRLIHSNESLRLLDGDAKPASGAYEEITVNVWRNHGIELATMYMEKLARLYGIEYKFWIGGYDNTLNISTRKDADVDLVWIDRDFYKSTDLVFGQWMSDRVNALYKSGASLVIVAISGAITDGIVQEIEKSEGKVFVLERELGLEEEELYEPRLRQVTGSRIGFKAIERVVRHLGLEWLTLTGISRLKAIVVDLDNTLYSGVVGEDGVEGLLVSEGHIQIQKLLRSLACKGYFIAIASKNNQADVECLWESGKLDALGRDSISVEEAGWERKSVLIENICSRLNIGVDSILFIDDNINEILEVYSKHKVKCIRACQLNPSITAAMIKSYPGTRRLLQTKDDLLRLEDQRMNKLRRELLEESDEQEEYFRGLEIVISVKEVDGKPDLMQRASELSNKVNQFNMTFSRYSLAEVKEIIDNESMLAVLISVRDKYSDSGDIALVVLRQSDHQEMNVEEMCISCRALGRELEDYIFSAACTKAVCKWKGIEHVSVEFKSGDRNKPALNWLSRIGSFQHEGVVKASRTQVCGMLNEAIERGIEFEGEYL